MNYEAVESEIVEKLKDDINLLDIADIEVLPDDVDNYKTPTIKGLVTVVFIGEKFDKNQSVGQVSQHTTASFNVSVQARKLRGTKGVYFISELIKKNILGFRPTDCGVMTLGDHDFAGYQNDIWEHSITFECRSLRVREYAYFIDADEKIGDEDIFYHKNNVNENIHL